MIVQNSKQFSVFIAPTSGIYLFSLTANTPFKSPDSAWWLKLIVSLGYWETGHWAKKVRIAVRRNEKTYFYIHDNSEQTFCNNIAYTWKMDMLQGDKLEFFVTKGGPLMATHNEPIIFTAELINVPTQCC